MVMTMTYKKNRKRQVVSSKKTDDGKKASKISNTPRMRIKRVEGDGNCLMRSIAYHIYGDVEQHGRVRQETCDYMEFNKEFFAPLICNEIDDMSVDIDTYIMIQRIEGEWCGEPQLVCMANLYGVIIMVTNKTGESMYTMEYHPNGISDEQTRRVQVLLRENHYDIVL